MNDGHWIRVPRHYGKSPDHALPAEVALPLSAAAAAKTALQLAWLVVQG